MLLNRGRHRRKSRLVKMLSNYVFCLLLLLGYKIGTPMPQWNGRGLYPSHTALRERHDASVTAKSSVAEASRHSRISIIAAVEPSCYRPVTFPVTAQASPKHHRKIKHVQFFPRPLGDCLVTERSWACRGHVV